jgi:hypothetical protein
MIQLIKKRGLTMKKVICKIFAAVISMVSVAYGIFLIFFGTTTLYWEITNSMKWTQKVTEIILENTDDIWMLSWVTIFGIAFAAAGLFCLRKLFKTQAKTSCPT